MNYCMVLFLSIAFLPSLKAGEQENIRGLNDDLNWAILTDNLDNVQASLASGTDPNGGDFLSRAAKNTQILQLLLEAKADPNHKKRIPLISAALVGNSGGVKMLLDYGADFDRPVYHREGTILDYIIDIEGISPEIKQLVQAASDKRKELKLFNDTFALAYKRQLEGNPALVLPREMVNIEIAKHMATPPFAPEIAAREEIIELFKELPFYYEL